MPSDPSFADLMARLQAGDDEAASTVFHRFAKRLIVLAHQRLDTQLRQKVDAEDVIQSVFRSFFAHQAAGELLDLRSRENLWGMLVVMTLRKCRRQKRLFYADRRDVRREVALSRLASEMNGSELYDREPTPGEAAVLTETVEELLYQFTGRPRKILVLYLQGSTVPEISSQMGCTERAVYRTYERVQEWLRCQAGE
jgi:RNA polymerase sigma-70 factor (ECF subfamily)